MRGICPKCNKTNSINGEAVDIKQPGTKRTWKGVSYSCSSCNCILSVQIDPVALKADVIADVLKALGKG